MPENSPLISLIVPVYNAEKYLGDCIDSLINQTYKNLEIILVDDGSSDRSLDICNEYSKKDKRIKVFHKENGGQASARNLGTKLSTGEYIGFIDSDDFIVNNACEILINNLLENDADISCCGIEKIYYGKHISYFNNNINEFFVVNTFDAEKILIENKRITSSTCDKLFKREILLKEKMTEGMIFEDHEVMHRWIGLAKKVVYCGNPLYKYRMTATSTMRGKFSERQFYFALADERRIEYFKKNYPELVSLAKSAYVNDLLDLIYRSRTNKSCKTKRKELIKKLKILLKENKSFSFERNLAIKVFAFKIGVPIYMSLMRIIKFFKRDKYE